MWWGLSGDFAELLAGAELRESPWWFVVLEKEDQSCWTARNLISGHSCLFHLVLFPLTRQTHTFWRGYNTHCLFLPHHRNIWLGSPPVFLMLASSNTSDIKLADHPLPSFWTSVWFFPSNGTCPKVFLRGVTPLNKREVLGSVWYMP